MLSTVIGADEAKRVLSEACSLHSRFVPGTFVGVRRLPSAVLLYGPPGTGKTMLVQQLAADSGRRLVSVSPGSLLSKWTGESEKVLAALFREAAGEEGRASARRYSPAGRGGEQQRSCSRERSRSRSRSSSPVRELAFAPSAGILFLDEADALAPKREGNSDLGSRRLLNELLILMSRYGEHGAGGGEEQRLLLIAATNRPEDCDPAFLRRFDRRVYVGLPSAPVRAALLSSVLAPLPHSLTPADFEALGAATEGWSCADLTGLAREAALGPIRDALAGEGEGGAGEMGLADVGETISLADALPAHAPASSPHHRTPALDVRPVCAADFTAALCSVTAAAELEGGTHIRSHASGSSAGSLAPPSPPLTDALLRSLLAAIGGVLQAHAGSGEGEWTEGFPHDKGPAGSAAPVTSGGEGEEGDADAAQAHAQGVLQALCQRYGVPAQERAV